MLEKQKIPLDHIACFYGDKTVLEGGKEYRGVVFERVLNDDDTPAVLLRRAIDENLLPLERIYRMLEDLHRNYLLRYAIIFGDCNFDNIMLRRVDKAGKVSYSMLLIDGIGTKNNDWKLNLRLRFHILAREVQIRRWWRIRRELQQNYYKKGRFAWFARFNWWWRLHFYLDKRALYR
jgi:hypothetical protein